MIKPKSSAQDPHRSGSAASTPRVSRGTSRRQPPPDQPVTPAGSPLASPPPAARVVFAASLPAVTAYAELLAGAGVQQGLIGPREVPRLWKRHLLNCAGIAAAIPPSATVDDVGSGAGLPGIVLALLRPDLQVRLIEPQQRRARFLATVVERLELPNATVCRARAQDLHGGRGVEVVTARAVAPLGRLAAWSLPLLVPGGSLLAIKGAGAEDEVRTAVTELRRLGATAWSIEEYGSTRVVRVVAGPPSTSVGGSRA